MTTTNSENYYRVVTLLVDTGTEVLRKLFMKYAVSSGAATVHNYLSNEQARIFKLQKSKHLKSHQVSLLLGQSSGSGIDIKAWDINLLCVLLMNICPVSQQEESAIECLRVLRNTVYGHAGDATLNQSDFIRYWQKIEAEILLLSQSCADTAFDQNLRKIISKIKTGPLSIESAVEALKLWYSQDQSTSAKLAECSLKLEELLTEVKDITLKQTKSENPVLVKLKQHSKIVLNELNLDCFVETAQTARAKQMLKKKNVVFIYGTAGEGKTVCAFAIASFSDREKLVLLSKASQVEQIEPNAVDMIIIDDIFGRSSFDQERFNDWKACFESIESLVKYSGVKVIITLRTEIWSKCQSEMTRYEIFTHSVELNTQHISDEEKQEILTKHLLYCGRKIDSLKIDELVDQFNLPFGFPSCAYKFASQEELFHLEREFFNLPYLFIRERLVTMDKELYSSLLFLFYKKDICLDADLKPQRRMKMVETNPNVTLLNDIAKLIGVNTSKISLPSVQDLLESLSDILVKHRDKMYSFTNTTVYNCIALYHGERYPEEVVENCTIDFLCQHVEVDESMFRSKAALVIEPDSYDALAERVIQEVIENQNAGKIVNSSVFHSKSFCMFLAQALLDSKQIKGFLTGDNEVTEANDSTVKLGFLEIFTEAKSDQLCEIFITELLLSASKTAETDWYKELKRKVEELLAKKGYHTTLQSVIYLK